MIALAGDGVRSEAIPATPGVYAIYDETEARRTSACPARCPRRSSYVFELPKQCALRGRVPADADKSDLQRRGRHG